MTESCKNIYINQDRNVLRNDVQPSAIKKLKATNANNRQRSPSDSKYEILHA